MCSHKHRTIVHQHLYNIKGVIYKSTGVIHKEGAGQGTLSVSSLQFLHLGGARGDVTRPGYPSFGPVVWEKSRSVKISQDQSFLEIWG